MRPQTIVERLDFVAKRVQGLKFTPPTQLTKGDDQFYGCFMSCDMYYIEIKVDQSHQSVKDVIISHGNSSEGISCPVLRKVLADQDFETFAKHLTGLHSIYQINTNDKKVKQRAYPAMTALETDLTILYEHQRRRTNNCHDLVHKSPIGHMEPRKGGLPVKLTFFITPYDLVDIAQKGFINLNVNSISEKNLGLSATVEIEGSNQHKIQIRSLIMQHNSSLPIYAPFNSQNSEKLPAQFVLVLSQRFPMLNTSISQIINDINEPATIKEYLSTKMTKSRESIISLIAREELELNKGPFCRPLDGLNKADSELCDLAKHVYSVLLPDQSHTYHISDNYLERPDGVYIEKIPFTHPTSIPSIIKVLRQQAMFNFIIASCIRRNKNAASTNPTTDENNARAASVFDVLPVSLNNICVSFEYPTKESLTTLEIDLKDHSCRLYALNKESVCSDEFATKVLQKCWSIPVTLRSVLKKCNERRLALLEDSNKRRERELQELLANNSSTQQGVQLNKSNHKQPETLVQNKHNATSDKAIPRDLNAIAEFLSSKAHSNATNSGGENSSDANTESSNRSNLLKKFSCKPKVKHSTATKSQSGNKILSLMLKRQNSTTTAEDPQYRGPITKKIKTKNSSFESSSGDNSMTAPTLTTTKLISPSEVVATTRTVIKQTKQGTNNLNVSLSLTRSPNKSQPSAISSSTNSSAQAGSALSSKNSESQGGSLPNVKVKLQSNGVTGGLIGPQKPRKSSINSVLERLVGNVTPEQQNLMNQLNSAEGSSADSNRTADSSRASTGFNGPKSKSRAPGGDQFAIKQGSSGGGLKLTVTKTKPIPVGSTLSSSGNNSSASSTTQAISNVSSAPTTSASTPTNASPSKAKQSSADDKPASKSADTGSSSSAAASTPSIRYTIPKISKTQQASQSSNQSNANSSDKSTSHANDTSNQQHADESNNPSSSASNSTTPSSTTTKRTTSDPFKRNIGSNRNPVSSSTHPPNRATSNPLAGALGRPSSASNVNNHIMGRISSSSAGVPPGQSNMNSMGQPVMSRSVNLMPQPILGAQGQVQAQPQLMNPPQHFNVAQRFLSAGLLPQQATGSLPLMGQPLPPQMFSLRMPQQPGMFTNPNDLNLIAASQVALLNQQQQQLQQQQQQQSQLQPQQAPSVFPHLQHQPMDQLQQQPQQQQQQQQANVSSSSDNSSIPIIPEQATSSSTPSSPTECSQVETVAPPPLIPIDSLHDGRPASADEDRDDESDRLSIVDMNESIITDGGSAVGTPKSSDVTSQGDPSQDSGAPAALSGGPIESSSMATGPTSSTATSNVIEQNMDTDVVMGEPEAAPSHEPSPPEPSVASQPSLADANHNMTISSNTTQSPQSSAVATTTNSD